MVLVSLPKIQYYLALLITLINICCVKVIFSNHSCLFFRAFSFKKKSPAGTTKVEIPSKVISSNVLANRNVNVFKSSLVTESPLIFPNKTEKPQKSKINNFYPINSKGKSDSISSPGDCVPAVQPSSAVIVPSKVSGAPSNPHNQFTSCTGSNSKSLDESLGFPMDDWDDFDDFEPSSKPKNDSLSSEISEKCNKSVLSPSEEKTQSTEKQFCTETDELERSNNKAEVSPRPSPSHDPVECELEDFPVKKTRRHLPVYKCSVISDSEEDSNALFETFEERQGKNVLFLFIYFICTLQGRSGSGEQKQYELG